MPFISKKAKLIISSELKKQLTIVSRSRTGPTQRVERAKILLAYEAGNSISAIARDLKTNRPKVERCINKALQVGALVSLVDLPGEREASRDHSGGSCLGVVLGLPKAKRVWLLL